MLFHRLSVRFGGLPAIVLLGIGCSAGSHRLLARIGAAESLNPANSELKTVLIDHFTYEPDRLAIHVGDRVEWKNLDIVPHTATAMNKKGFDSGRIAKDASWRFTVTRKGRYEYHCTLHPNMKAELIVQ